MQKLSMKLDNEDIDYMHYTIDRYAFPLTQRVPVEYNGLVFRVYTHGVHPGYARLINERGGEMLEHLLHDNLTANEQVHGPARRLHNLVKINKTLTQSGAAGDTNLGKLIPVQDHVLAVHSPYWPIEASEWIT